MSITVLLSTIKVNYYKTNNYSKDRLSSHKTKKARFFFFISFYFIFLNMNWSQRGSYLPLLIAGMDRTTKELVDHSYFVLLHHQVLLRMLISDDVARLAMLLVALHVNIR